MWNDRDLEEHRVPDHLMNHLTVRENGLDSHRGGGMVHHGSADILDGHSLLGHGGDLLAENNMMLGHMGDQVGPGTRYRAGRRCGGVAACQLRGRVTQTGCRA